MNEFYKFLPTLWESWFNIKGPKLIKNKANNCHDLSVAG